MSNQPAPMIRYRAEFYGCAKNAIGMHYNITAHVSGINPDDARLRLYDCYDHVVALKLTPLGDREDQK